LRRFAERCHGVGRELTGGGQRGVARVGPFKPGLRRGAIVRLQRLQFPPRLVEVISQRSRGDPRHHGAAIGAGGVGALDLDQLGGARLQALDDAGAGRGMFCCAAGDSFGTSASNSGSACWRSARPSPRTDRAASGIGLGASALAVGERAG
jgi:hypothetical protein